VHARKHWTCYHCGHAYDRPACEAALVEGIVRQVAAYQMQDLRCSRCKQIKAANLAVHCDCSGVFRTTEPRAEMMRRFKVAAAIAEWYGFEALAEVVAAVLE
jgi:DNA polymerase epsilon subunit 1